MSDEVDADIDMENKIFSYYNYSNQKIGSIMCSLWEGNQNLLTRIYNLKPKTEKISVTFLVPDIALWDVYHPIYDKLVMCDEFKVNVIAFKRCDVVSDKSEEDIAEFFSSRKIDVRLSGFNQNYFNHNFGDDDLVIYTLGSVAYPDAYKIEYVSLFARTCYIPYGFLLANEYDYQFNQDFHHSAWVVIASSNREVDLYKKYQRRIASNVIKAEYSKFEYLKKGAVNTRKPERKIVIWAPHWTIGLVYPRLNYGMFDIFCNDFIKIAQDNPEVDFVFKPHPNLRYALNETGFMDFSSYEVYLSMLKSIGNIVIYNGGDYTDLFIRSSGMITDSISFLAEYAVTGNPLLFLDRVDRVPLSPLGEDVIGIHYKGREISCILNFVQDVVIDGNDVMKIERETSINDLLGIGAESTSNVILDLLLKSRGGNG